MVNDMNKRKLTVIITIIVVIGAIGITAAFALGGSYDPALEDQDNSMVVDMQAVAQQVEEERLAEEIRRIEIANAVRAEVAAMSARVANMRVDYNQSFDFTSFIPNIAEIQEQLIALYEIAKERLPEFVIDLDELLADGKLTQEQYDLIINTLDSFEFPELTPEMIAELEVKLTELYAELQDRLPEILTDLQARLPELEDYLLEIHTQIQARLPELQDRLPELQAELQTRLPDLEERLLEIHAELQDRLPELQAQLQARLPELQAMFPAGFSLPHGFTLPEGFSLPHDFNLEDFRGMDISDLRALLPQLTQFPG
jgi:uncharacterized protein YdhG (YjbR/CyaY superfamily)